MKIGYYIPAWPPGSVPNGIVTTLGHLGRQLRSLGHEIFYITPTVPADLEDTHVIPLKVTDNNSWFEKLNFRLNFESALFHRHANAIAYTLDQLIEREGIDIFQMEETHGWALKVIDASRVPVVVRLHGPWFLNHDLGASRNEKPENRRRIEREGKAIHAANALAAPSKNVMELTRLHYHVSPPHSEVIPNPMNVRSPDDRWNLNRCDRNEILFVGRFDRIKGADILLRAFARVAAIYPQLKLTFVGPDIGLVGSDGQSMNFAEFCKQEIPDNVHGRIDFRGTLPRTEIEKLRTRAYLTIVASRYEVFGNVVVEAMAAGSPIIASNTGGIPEIISSDHNGLIVEAGSVDALEQAIAQFIDKPDLANSLAQQAALDCADRFDPEKIARRTIDFYSTVIGNFDRPGNLRRE
jgi:glycosyltransferase involved in cell wall biosynthesis